LWPKKDRQMTRIFLQSPHLPDMAVVTAGEESTSQQIKALCLAALPEQLRTADLEIFDEVDIEHDVSVSEDEDPRHHDKSAPIKSRRVHVGRCKRVAVKVRYAGRSVEHAFQPMVTIERLKKWATRELNIAPQDSIELTLQLAGTEIQPPRDKHVGCFVGHECEVVFDLVRAYTVNGDSDVHEDQARLLAHLESGSFLIGTEDGRWKLQEVIWPFVLVDVMAFNGDVYTLRLQCEGYPTQPPTGIFWDMVNNIPLASNRWPRAGVRVGQALRPDGAALYIPCDRLSIAGHDQWTQLYSSWLWDAQVGLTRYLQVVSELIGGTDYVSPNA
jgi:hypothetical protein